MKKDINIKIFKADNFFKKLLGIMFKMNKLEYGILFKNIHSIHTFFCFQKIDVIMMNKDFKVLYIFNELGKNKIIKKNSNVFYTLELPERFIKEKNIGINDTLNLTNIQK